VPDAAEVLLNEKHDAAAVVAPNDVCPRASDLNIINATTVETIVVGHINYFILNRHIINIYCIYIIILYYYTAIVRDRSSVDIIIYYTI